MCQISRGQCQLGDRCSETGVERVEGLFEACGDGVMAGQGRGEAWTEEMIIGSREEQSSAETAVGDVVSVAVWLAFDQAVEAQAAQLVGHGAGTEGLSRTAAEFGQMGAQVGSAKAVWQQAEEEHGVP